MPTGSVFFGEVALSGEIRPVAHAPLRLREAGKLGFSDAAVPPGLAGDAGDVRLHGYRTLSQYVDRVLGRG